MKLQYLLTFCWIFPLCFLLSCENNNKPLSESKIIINYSDKSVLDSLIKNTIPSTDTIFLGFQIGMTPQQYESHVKRLRDEGKIITFSPSNIFSLRGKRFDLGPGYTFITDITSVFNGKNITGKGQYFLSPTYDKNQKLVHLSILPVEEWNHTNELFTPDWLKEKIKENSNSLVDSSLKKAMNDGEITEEGDMIREKGGVIIFISYISVNYIDKNARFLELEKSVEKKENIKKQNESLTF